MMRIVRLLAPACLVLAMGLGADLLAQESVVAKASADGAKPKPQQEEKQPVPPPPQEEPLPPSLRLEEDAGGLLDLDWLEMHARVGIAIFSDTYKIDPSPQVSVLFHAPMPWLSPSSDPGGEYFGAYLELTLLPSVERDLEPPPSGTKGSIFMVGAGLDFTLLRNQSLFLTLQAGGQYCSYGGIADLDDGFAPVAGLNAGVYVGGGLTLTLAPEMIFVSDGDSIVLASLGLVIEF
jgi:hypothetical protein